MGAATGKSLAWCVCGGLEVSVKVLISDKNITQSIVLPMHAGNVHGQPGFLFCIFSLFMGDDKGITKIL